MPLWDNFARVAEALPVVAPHGAEDFVAMQDQSLGAVTRTQVQNLRSREIFTVNLFTSVSLNPATTATTAPLRVFRAPYAFTITSVVLHCVTAPAGTFAADVFNAGLSIFDGGNLLNSTKLALSSGTTRTQVTSFSGNAQFDAVANSEFRFYVAATQTAIRLPQVTLLGFRN